MSTTDRILNLIGAAAAGVVVVGASGGAAIPAWLMITAGVVSYATGAVSAPLRPSSLLPGKLIPGTNQRIDKEDPK